MAAPQQAQQQAQPAQQQAAPQQQQQQQQQAAAATDKMRGTPPAIYNGDRRNSEQFLRDFNVFWGLNENHEIFTVPYFRAMYALSLMRGPHVNDWANAQVQKLRDNANHATAPIPRNDNRHWDTFNREFTDAYTDTAKEQNAVQQLQALKMFKDDLDTYIATFKNLAARANYALDAKGTIHLFAQGLSKPLLKAILFRDQIPNTMDNWITAAQDEVKKHSFRQSMLNPNQHMYDWHTPVRQRNGNNRRRIHPNDQVVPMDVDPPVFTQVNRAYTQEDKRKHRDQGKCFECSRFGHMAKDCPMRKRSQGLYRTPNQRSYQSNPRPPMQGIPRKSNKQRFKKQFPKPTRLGQPSQSFAHTAYLEEVIEDDEEDIPELAARTAKLSEDQREEWMKELHSVGINF
jgi:hypothetical protein